MPLIILIVISLLEKNFFDYINNTYTILFFDVVVNYIDRIFSSWDFNMVTFLILCIEILNKFLMINCGRHKNKFYLQFEVFSSVNQNHPH